MLLRIKRLLFIVMIMVITFCGVKVEAYFQFNKSSNVSFTTASYSNLTLSTDKTTYGICNQEPTLTFTVTNANAYNVIYTLSFSDANLTYEIDGASGASYTVLGGGSKTHTITLLGTTTSTSLTVTLNATFPYKSTHTKSVTLDISCPSQGITSTNNVATSQTVTVTCSDTEGMASYYWGTKSAPATSDFVSQTSNLSTTKTVNAAGTYYLVCKDKNGNSSSTNKTFYKTTFTMANGTVSPTSVITMNGNGFALPTPTATAGYTNKGAWYTSTAYSTSKGNYGATYKPTSSTTLYSTATANTYTINYYLGSTSVGTSTCVYNSSCTLKTWATLGATFLNNDHGWSFAGWNTTTTGTARTYTNGGTFTYNTVGNINLYAVGSRTFKFYSGEAPTSAISTQTQYWNTYSTTVLTSITIPTPTEITGWEFIGYRGNNTASSETYYNVNDIGTTQKPGASNLTSFDFRSIYKRTVTINYNANGGSGTTNSTTGTQYYNSGLPSGGTNVSTVSLTLAANGFSKTGYTFSKWAAGSTSGTEYLAGGTYSFNNGVSASSSITMYAKWSAINYTIGYTMNGGTQGTNKPESGTYGSLVTIDNPSKTFTVNINNSASGTLSATSASSVQTFAGWTASGLDTTNAKYGTTTSPSTTWSNGSTKVTSKYFKNLRSTSGAVALTANWTLVAVKLPTVTKTGHTCGYTATSGSSTITYASGTNYIPSASTNNITLYTVCTANTYTVEYYTYNGGTKLGSSSHTYGVSKALTTMATLGGSTPNTSVTFYGWATSANGTTRIYTDGQSISNLTSTNGGVIKLYAIYRSAGVVITYKSGVNSATSTTSGTYYYYNASTSVSITTETPAAITSWTSLGWRDDTTASTREYSSATANNFSASKTLYAVYSRSYTANFYSGASKSKTTTVTSSTAYYNSNTSATPTTVSITLDTQANSADITNWTELGWRADTTASTKVYSYGAANTVAWGTNFYSVYSRTLTVSYNCNGGTGSTSSTTTTVYLNANSTTTSSQAVSLRANSCTRTGYTFSKWAAGSTSGTQYAAGASYNPSLAYNASTFGTTMYAVWSANTYTVEYYTYNGGTKLGSSSHTYGTAKALTTMATLGGSAPNTSVTFYGWSTSANGTTRSYTDGESVSNLTSTNGGVIKLYAIYRSAGVVITYKSGVNSATSTTSSTYYYYNASTSVSITTETPAAITSWTTLGWRDDTTASTREYSSATANNFSASKTLYAVYSRSYTANFYSGASKSKTTTVTSSTVYYNSNTSATPTTVSITLDTAANSADITNWTELGWRADTTASTKVYSYGAANTVAWGTNFYSVYSRTLTVSYNCNGGTGSTSSTTTTVYLNANSTTTSSQAVSLRANSCTRTGYTFSKWAAGSTSGTQYAAGASYNPSLAYNASTFGTTMYAVWSANTYTVEYYTYNGGTKLGSSSHTYGSSKALTTMATLGGSAPNTSVTFYGWATSANGTTRIYTDGQSVSNLTSTNGGVIKLYAIYRSAGVVITYKSGVNSATSTTSSTYYYYNASTSVSITTGTPAAITSWNTQGWRDDTSVGSIEYSSATAYNFSASKTLYGIYSRSYAATFYSGVSKGTSKALSSSTATYNSNTASLPTTVSITLDTQANSADIANWTEIGWRDDTSAGAKEYSYGGTATVAWGTNFYSVYSRTLTVSYNCNGGSGSTSSTTTTVYLNANSTTTSSQAVSLRANSCTRTGYTFSKWAAGSTSGTQYAAGTSYNPNVAYNASTFGTTMYAIWTANTYTIEYYTYNGGTKLGSSSHTYGSSKALTTMATLGGSAPNTSVTFYGWSTSANGTTRSYTDGESVSNLTSTNGGVIKLYAIYRSAGVVITYKSGVNSATSTTSSTYYYYNASTSVSITTGTPAAITSWNTQGWRDDTSVGSIEYSSATAYNFSASKTLYGIYSRSYAATFYSGVSKGTSKALSSSTATYNSNTASLPTTVSITLDTQANSADIANWSELGWRDDTTAGAKEYSYGGTATVAWGTNFYSVYSRTLTVSYNCNGGTGSTSSTTTTVYLNANSTTTSSQAVSLRANSCTRTGYTFSKWAAGSASGTQYAAGASYNPNVAYNASTFGTTMYAIWTANSYTINYVDNRFNTNSTSTTVSGLTYSYNPSNYQLTLNGTPTGSIQFQSAPHTFVSGETYRVTLTYVSGTVSGSGYAFVTEAKKYETASLTTRNYLDRTFPASGSVYGDITFTAATATEGKELNNWLWLNTGSTLSFSNYVVRVEITKVDSRTMTYGNTLGTLPTPTRQGYTFNGWYTARSGGTKISSSTSVPAANTAYYAQWTVNNYKVYVDGNGGSIPSTSGWTNTTAGNGNALSSKSVTYLGTYGTLPTPTRTGHTFSGWSNILASTTLTLSASTSNNYNYQYIYSSAIPGATYTITMDSATLTAGSATQFRTLIYDFTTNTPLASATTNFGSNITYTIAAPTEAIATNKLAIIIYAGINGQTANHGAKYTNIKVSTTSTTTSKSYTSSSTVVTPSAHELIAKWNINSYTVTYSCSTNGGSGNTTASVAYGGAIDLTKTCTPASGWTFVGWNTSSTATSKISSATMSTSNVTLYAIYSKSVTVTFNANGCTSAAGSVSMTLYNNGTSGSVTVPSKTMNSGWTTLGASASSTSTSSGTAMGSSMSITGIGSSTTAVTRYYNCYKAEVSRSVTYSKGDNVSAIGSTSGSCTIAAVYNGASQSGSCSVTLPTITANTGYTAVGWSTTNGATSGTAAGGSYSLSSNTTLFANATDQTKPSCSFSSWSTSSIMVDRTATITVTCTDAGSGLSTTSLTSSNFTISDTNALSISSITTANATNGKAYTITVTALNKTATPKITLNANAVADASGNKNNAVSSSTISTTADTEGPYIEFGTDGNSNYAKSQSSSVKVVDHSTMTAIKYLWTQTAGASAANGTSFSTVSTTSVTETKTKSDGNGTWYLCVYAADSRGNSNNACTEAFLFDNTAPTITLPSNPLYIAKGATADLTTYASFTDSLSGINTKSANHSNASSLALGTYSLTYTATDKAGNSKTATVTLAIYTNINCSLSGMTTDPTNSARCIFRGSNPNNYIKFNASYSGLTASGGTLYRIIGTETDKTSKIVHSGSLVTRQFHSSAETAWATSTLRSYLNGTASGNYYETFNTQARNHIQPTKFNIGTMNYYVSNNSSKTIADTVNAERGAQEANASYVGLMSVYDFLLASSNCSATTTWSTIGTKSNGNFPCDVNNWLVYPTSGAAETWFITPYSGSRLRRWLAPACTSSTCESSNSGSIQYANPTASKQIRPAIYLKESVIIIDGTGTSSDPYILAPDKFISGISSATCTITAASGYLDSQTLTINSSTSGITYSWDGVNFSSTNTKTGVQASGTYTAYIKDGEGKTNKCTMTLNSRTEYRTASCTRKWNSWAKSSEVWVDESECTEISKSTAEANGSDTYVACQNPGGGSSQCIENGAGPVCKIKVTYKRTCYRSNCGSFGSWGTTKYSKTCTRDVETKTTYGV